ncbi:TVP38/TMEM64 family protein [Kaarinaea lacus]
MISAFFAFDLGEYLTLEYMQSQRQQFIEYYNNNTAVTIAVYFGVYVAVTALSLPGAAIMTLVGGAVFGLLVGVVVVSFASSIGATLAFLVSRFVLRDYVQNKFGDKLRAINQGIEKEGAFYLFTLRLIPAFPFFVINLVMGITTIRTLQFYIVSQLGMLAGTVVFVNAGSQLGSIESVSGILSPQLLASFALLGLFPLIAKKIIDFIKARRLQNANH